MHTNANQTKREYLIIYVRWIRGSDQNGETLVGKSGRKKEARGIAKSDFISHMEMLIAHQYPFDDYEIDEDNHWIALADEEGLWYYVQFYVEEIDGY